MIQNEVYQIIGKRIREVREKHQYSQDALSKLLPLSRASIVNIESGRHRIQLHVLYQIAKSLNEPISIYFAGELIGPLPEEAILQSLHQPKIL